MLSVRPFSLLVALPLAAVVASPAWGAPSARSQARDLYKEAKALIQQGKLDAGLAKRIEGHALYPNAKVVRAIIARLEETDRLAEAAGLLEGVVASGNPSGAVSWAKSWLKAKTEALAEATRMAEEAKAKAETEAKAKAEVEAKAAAEAEAKAKAEEEAKAKAEEERHKAEAEARAKEVEEAGRKAVEAALAQAAEENQRKEAAAAKRRLPTLAAWAGLGVAGTALATALAFEARSGSASDLADECAAAVRTPGGACSAHDYGVHAGTAANADADANLFWGVGAVTAAAAGAGLYYLSLKAAEDAGAAEATVVPGPGGLAIAGRF